MGRLTRLALALGLVVLVQCGGNRPPRPPAPLPVPPPIEQPTPEPPPPQEPPPVPPSAQAPGQGEASWLRGDFLTAFFNGHYLNTGEYPALSVAKRVEIRQWAASVGANHLMLETEWPGDANVPAFSWTRNPAPLLAVIPELRAAGIEPLVVFGLEGTGQTISAAFVRNSEALARKLRAAGLTRAIVGIECEEWSGSPAGYQLYRQLVAALKRTGLDVYTHFHGGVISHPFAASTAQFYRENPGITGLVYQFNKESRQGRFLVPDDNLLAQIENVRALLPTHIILFAGEYANLVSQDKARHAGAVALSSGKVRGFMNGGPGKDEPHLPAAVASQPSVRDDLPINTVSFSNLHGDITRVVRSWPIDAQLNTVVKSGRMVTFPHTGSGRWPLAPNGIEGNVWECGQVRGKNVCQTWDYIKSFAFSKEWTGTGLRLDAGTPLYFMVSATARDKFENGPHRSQIRRVNFR